MATVNFPKGQNKMSLSALKAQNNNDDIQVYPSFERDADGKVIRDAEGNMVPKRYSNGEQVLFFAIGSITGYVSEKAATALKNGQKDSLVYQELPNESGEFIPCITTGSSLKPVYTI